MITLCARHATRRSKKWSFALIVSVSCKTCFYFRQRNIHFIVPSYYYETPINIYSQCATLPPTGHSACHSPPRVSLHNPQSEYQMGHYSLLLSVFYPQVQSRIARYCCAHAGVDIRYCCALEVYSWRCPPFSSRNRSRIISRTWNMSWKCICLSNF